MNRKFTDKELSKLSDKFTKEDLATFTKMWMLKTNNASIRGLSAKKDIVKNKYDFHQHVIVKFSFDDKMSEKVVE